MGRVNKHANLYTRRGKLIAKAPLQGNEGQPISTKYPGGVMSGFRLHKTSKHKNNQRRTKK